jgi:hypothetical protein
VSLKAEGEASLAKMFLSSLVASVEGTLQDCSWFETGSCHSLLH